jgi:hypothetical protein
MKTFLLKTRRLFLRRSIVSVEDNLTLFTLLHRAVFKFEGSSILCTSKGEGFEDFRAQFSDEERAFGYLRLQVKFFELFK